MAINRAAVRVQYHLIELFALPKDWALDPRSLPNVLSDQERVATNTYIPFVPLACASLPLHRFQLKHGIRPSLVALRHWLSMSVVKCQK